MATASRDLKVSTFSVGRIWLPGAVGARRATLAASSDCVAGLVCESHAGYTVLGNTFEKVKGGWCAGVSDGARINADNSVLCDMMKD